jgi:hypothetical protein
MDPRDQYRTLYTYLGGSLHEDWTDEFSDPAEALEDLLAALWDSSVEKLLQDLEDVLAMPDQELLAALKILSRNLNPRLDYGWDEREWLTSIRDRVRLELERRRAASQGDSQA